MGSDTFYFRFVIWGARCLLFLSLTLGLIVTGGLALAETGKAPDKKAALRGEKLYAAYCQSCHGKRGVGESISPPFVRRPGYFLAPALDDSQHAWHHSDEDLVTFILKGSTRTKRMVAFKAVLSEKQVRDIVAYVKSLWGSRALDCQGPKHMSCPR